MLMTEERPATSESVWTWRFTCIEALVEDGLEQYTAFLDDGRIGRYGEECPGGEVNEKLQMCSARKRYEIDRCMDALEYPFFVKLLDLYYRRGASTEHKGWCDVARLMGLRGDPKSRWDRSTFERQLELAVDRLWRAHEGRWERRS